MIQKSIILGSGSFSRKQILTDAGYSFTVRKANIDEKLIGNRNIGTIENAKDIVTKLAFAKAKAILQTFHNNDEDLNSQFLLTADQVVVSNNLILEKPCNEEEVKHHIHQYSNNYCQTIGSVVITDIRDGKQVSGIDTARIYFNQIPNDVIESLIREGMVYNCAGGLIIEHPLVQPCINRIEGRMDSVMGLSIELVENLLHQLQSVSS